MLLIYIDENRAYRCHQKAVKTKLSASKILCGTVSIHALVIFILCICNMINVFRPSHNKCINIRGSIKAMATRLKSKE